MLAAHELAAAAQDMDTDLIAFEDFFSAATDEIDDEIWSIPREPLGSEDHDLLDAEDLQPLDPDEDRACRSVEPFIKSEPPLSPLATSRIDTQSFLVKDEAKPEPTLAERRKTLLAPVTSTFTSSPRAKRRISEANMITEDEQEQAMRDAKQDEGDGDYDEEDYEEEEDDDCGHGCGHGEDEGDALVLPDTPDYTGMPLLSDEDVAALVPSPTNFTKAPPYSSVATSKGSSTAADSALNGKQSIPAISDASDVVSEQDIPDVVTLFNSLYSPSTSPTRESQALSPAPSTSATASIPAPHSAPLRIVVPAPQPGSSGPTPMPGAFPFTANRAISAASNPVTSVLDYFTPPSYMPGAPGPNPNFFLSADSLSPALKASLLQGHLSAAAAMAMANSAAAMNTIRKLNTTYGVPIAPMQRSLASGGAELPLKPKLSTGGGSATRISATGTSGGKVTKISITPDIADFKLVQIFHHFCDPVGKVLTLPRFHQLLLHHQVKDDGGSSSGGGSGSGSSAATSGAKPSAVRSSLHAPTASTGPSTMTPKPALVATTSTPSGASAISGEAQHLFRLMDPSGSGVVDLERFMSSFQICNRCTEAKRRAHSALCAQQGQSFVPPTALERQLMEDVAPVIVRVVPTAFEGSKVRSCEHYQWTWCEGFAKTGNEKCRGTNRHDKCPKYLANCTLWKHKLPPKTRKPRAAAVAERNEVLDSPSKKLKHFG